MSANAITVKDVTKVYRLYDKPIDRLKESLSPTHKSYHKDFYALNGLSFNVEVAGEFTGSCENRSIFNQKAHDNSFHGYMMRPGPRRGTGVS